MKQVQLEEWAWDALEAIASRQGLGVSDLIRLAVEEKYLRTSRDRVELFRAWKAPWRDRDDIADSNVYVRRLREDDRIERLYPE